MFHCLHILRRSSVCLHVLCLREAVRVSQSPQELLSGRGGARVREPVPVSTTSRES